MRFPHLPLSVFLAGALLAPRAFGQKDVDPDAQAFFTGSDWDALLAATDGGWHVDWNPATGTPRALYGRGLPIQGWRENSLAEARRHAATLLRERADLLGLGGSDFREALGARMGRTWSLVFDQYFRGLPCIGGRADVRVSMAGRIAMFGSTAWRLPEDFDTTATLTSEVARAIALQELSSNVALPPTAEPPTAEPPTAEPQADEPRLVIWGDVHAKTRQAPALAYEVPVNGIGAGGVGPKGRYYVDARTGAVLHFTSDKHECGLHCNHRSHLSTASATGKPATGKPATDSPATDQPARITPPPPTPTGITVFGAVRTTTDALAGPTIVPLPGLEIAVPGHGTYTTDASGTFTVDLLTPQIIHITPLDGAHHLPIEGIDVPPGAFQLIPGVSGSVQVSFPGATDTATAHLDTAWWTHRTNEFVRSVLGDTPELHLMDAMRIRVNIALTCNAYYSGNSLNFYAAGGGCLNMAQSTIIAHEWGHGLDERYGGLAGADGLGEGWADVVAMYLTDDPVIGKNFGGANTQIRTGTNTRQFPDGAGVHDRGESWMGFAWQLRERLAATRGRPTAIEVSNRIVLGSIVADAETQPAALLEVWLADDDDGDLTNGTPHAAELIWAADQHSLPDPAPAGLANDECAFPFALTNGLNGPFTNAGSTTSSPAWQCGLGANDVWFSYLAGAAGLLDVDTCGIADFDTVIEVFQGNCGALQQLACNDDACDSLRSRVTVPVQPGLYLLRVSGYTGSVGNFRLQVAGPAGSYGTATPFGDECGRSRSFFELFPPGTFDLANTSMRLVLAGDHYLVQPGGPFVPPPANAVDLGLGDENITTLPMPQPFPVPGGASSSLEVNSNGIVAAGDSSSLSYEPTIATWLSVAGRCWGIWHDLDASAPGSGRVKRHDTSDTTYITWDGVFSYDTNLPQTFQVQLHHSTGNVTIACQSMSLANYLTIVGHAAGGAATGFGERDLSVAVSATFRTSPAEVSATLSGTLPRLGQTVTLTSSFAAGVPLGMQVLGLQSFDPGVPLDVLGWTGCSQHASADVLAVLVPSGGTATYSLVVPPNQSLLGLGIAAQTVAFTLAGSELAVGMSRGLLLTIGL